MTKDSTSRMRRAPGRLSGRYRDEAKTVAERSEALVQELRAESERLTIRNAELGASLSQLTQANGQLDRSERDKSSQLAVLKKQLEAVTVAYVRQGAALQSARARLRRSSADASQPTTADSSPVLQLQGLVLAGDSRGRITVLSSSLEAAPISVIQAVKHAPVQSLHVSLH